MATPSAVAWIVVRSLEERRGPAAFTLIELLVVVAIISLLMSVLLPSLQRARDQAKTAICLTQQKQIGVGMAVYTNEHGRYPEMTWDSMRRPQLLHSWRDMLCEAMGWQGWMPGHRYRYGGTEYTYLDNVPWQLQYGGSSPFVCPAAKPEEEVYHEPWGPRILPPRGLAQKGSYSYNIELVWQIGGAGRARDLKADHVPSPGSFANVICGGGRGHFGRGFYYTPTTRSDAAGRWHAGNSTILLCDGHAEYLTVYEEMPLGCGWVFDLDFWVSPHRNYAPPRYPM